MEPRHLSPQDIRKIVLGLHSLDQKQRGVVTDVLTKLAHSADAKVSPEELRRELHALRAQYLISELDAKAIERAVFES